MAWLDKSTVFIMVDKFCRGCQILQAGEFLLMVEQQPLEVDRPQSVHDGWMALFEVLLHVSVSWIKLHDVPGEERVKEV